METQDQNLKQIKASEVVGFAVVVAHNLPHLAGILNEMRCDGAKNVEIKHLHVQQGKLAGQMEIHVLVYATENARTVSSSKPTIV